MDLIRFRGLMEVGCSFAVKCMLAWVLMLRLPGPNLSLAQAR